VLAQGEDLILGMPYLKIEGSQFLVSTVFILNTISSMKTKETDSKHRLRNNITDNFHRLKGASYYINFECIFTEDKIVNLMGRYDLLDFLEDGKYRLSTVKFLHADVNGNELKISLFHIDSRKTLHRIHCLNDNTIPCDWLLIAKDYFKDGLLEFDF
jgi:hypothetical protein